MEKRQIGLKLVMDQMGLPVTVDTFDDRLILQKAAYLAQATGVHLGYFFRWYLRGPYCSAVTEDGYAVCSEVALAANAFKDWTLDDASMGRLGRIKSIFGGEDRPRLARKLELLASTHFLIAQEQVPSRDPKVISERLRRFDKDFTADEVKEAIGEMKANGILS